VGSDISFGDAHGGGQGAGLGNIGSPSPITLYCATGVATRLSRRRVSCRELGRPDCDGWLLLRKAPGGFMGPRWRRCWFVLKRHTLYWYRQPQVRPRTQLHRSQFLPPSHLPSQVGPRPSQAPISPITVKWRWLFGEK
jgi:hypothetical protein